MTTIKTTLYIHKRITPSDWEPEVEINLTDVTDMFPWQGNYVLIGTFEIEIPTPNVDVTAQAIESLERQADDVMAQARAKVAELHDRIAKLRCLEHLEEGEA